MGIKRRTTQILCLFAAFVLSVAALCFTLAFNAPISADASTYTPSSIFGTTAATPISDGGYVGYDLNSGSSVYYRKNLALKWNAAVATDNEEDFDPFVGEKKYFSVEFSFGKELNFKKFSLSMEAGQFVSSKDGKSTNKIEFTVQDSKLYASVNGADAFQVPEKTVEGEQIVTVTFIDDKDGNFYLSLNGSASSDENVFTNIGKNYAQYSSSSSDTPVTPLTFKVEEIAEGKSAQKLYIRSLNGQSMALNENGSVEDTEAPVLVINSDVRQIILGEEIGFDYVTIDVLDSSVTTNRYFYGYDENKARVAVGEEESTYAKIDSDKVFFDKDFVTFDTVNGYGFASLAFNLSDGDNAADYYIEWYADALTKSDNALIKDDYSYIKAVRPGADYRPEYTFNDDTPEDTNTVGQNDIIEYQAKVDDAAYTDEGYSIQVGTGAYFYLPSLKPYIIDASCGYTDMQFDIYYRTNAADTKSLTGLDYNELKIELTAEGLYEFRVVPSNSFGKDIEGTIKDKDNPVKEITTSNIWEIQEIPTFTFSVNYNGVAIEEPEETEDGYIDVTYTPEGFEIISLTSDYNSVSTEYNLYYLEVNAEYEGKTISKPDLKASLDSMSTTYGTWRKIEVQDKDEDEDYKDNKYAWNPDSSLSFIPQEKGYYGITVTARDKGIVSEVAKESIVISVTSQADKVHGDTYWLQNNILSVVFLCIGGACLIGIVVLLLIKPKDKKETVVSGTDKTQSLKEKRKNRK